MTVSPLSPEEIRILLLPYLSGEVALIEDLSKRPELLEHISVYVGLLLRWNERINLTSIRNAREIVRRHFGESLYAARHLHERGTLLDLGSGAGFPGLAIQLWSSDLEVTLAESQSKKASFLREVIRSLQLPTAVWGGRAEEFPRGGIFDVVVMRGVDAMDSALRIAARLTRSDVWVIGSPASVAGLPSELVLKERIAMPESEASYLFHLVLANVPRGTSRSVSEENRL